MKNVKKLAVASVLSALAAVLLIVGSVFDIIDLTICAFASFTVIIAVIELNVKYAFAVYGVASLLSIIFIPMRTAPIYFAFFLGYYPILKYALAKTNRAISWLVKLSAFNTSIILMFTFFKSLFGLNDVKQTYIILLFVCANIFFVVYDYALSGIITLYIVKFRKLLKLKDMFK